MQGEGYLLMMETDNPLRRYWPSTPDQRAPLDGLKQIGTVEDMRPRHRGKCKHPTDTEDFGKVIEFIYQIRCNLFHGGKSFNGGGY